MPYTGPMSNAAAPSSTWTNRGGSPPPIEADMEGSPSYQYGNNPGVQTALTNQDNTYGDSRQDYGSTNSNYNPPPKQFDPNYFKLQRLLGYAAPIALGTEALLQKPFQMNAADYQVQGRMKPYDEQYRPDYAPYNAAMYNLKNLPGSANLAARTNLYNAGTKNFADEKYRVNQGNLARKMSSDQANLGIEAANKNIAMQIAQFNEQNKAARRNAIREQGMNLFSIGYNQQANNMMKEQLSAAYPDHRFSWNTPKNKVN
jgi:hypothetical protein